MTTRKKTPRYAVVHLAGMMHQLLDRRMPVGSRIVIGSASRYEIAQHLEAIDVDLGTVEWTAQGVPDMTCDEAKAWTCRANDPRAECPHCHGTGVVEVPSMVGFGVEPYVCRCAAGQALHPEYAAAIDATRKAWIDRAIR